MKKILFFAAVVALTTVSCTKDRTCTCNVTTEVGGASTTEEDKYTIKDATGGQAKANCVSTKQTSGTTNVVTTTSDCSLS